METHGKIPILSWMLVLLLLVFPAGCATTDFDELSKTVKGSIAGVATGAVAGGLATGNARGAIVGAIVGGFIGNRIGAYLDEQDQEQLRELQQQSLKSGKMQSFVTRKTGDTVIIEPGAAQQEVVETFEVAGEITEYDLIPADEVRIEAYVDTPVYAETNAKKKPRYVLQQGNSLHVPVRVAGKSGWGAVVEKGSAGGGQVVGYVPLSYLNKKTAKAYLPPKIAKKKPGTTRTAKNTGNAAPAPSPAASGGTVLASEAPKPEARPQEAAPPPPAASESGIIFVSEAPKSAEPVKTVDLNAKCRVILVKVKDKSAREEMRFCEKPPPKWVQI
ncbi:MAG: hypothetical protein LBI62_10405 [Candidatus Accumulibacter sp.]|jgi:hypothetical protein|nr:hypothetical protein [Accumulibacter sp.]